jgi:hypothetical protein
VVCFPKGEAFTDEVLSDVSGQHLRHEDLSQPCLNWSHGAYNTYREEEVEEVEVEEKEKEKEKGKEKEKEKKGGEYARLKG